MILHWIVNLNIFLHWKHIQIINVLMQLYNLWLFIINHSSEHYEVKPEWNELWFAKNKAYKKITCYIQQARGSLTGILKKTILSLRQIFKYILWLFNEYVYKYNNKHILIKMYLWILKNKLLNRNKYCSDINVKLYILKDMIKISRF